MARKISDRKSPAKLGFGDFYQLMNCTMSKNRMTMNEMDLAIFANVHVYYMKIVSRNI